MGIATVIRARIACRRELRNQGYGLHEINSVIGAVDGDEINATAAAIGPECAAAVGALGDGTILQAIIDFFKSPQGQALLEALVKMLIGLLVMV